MKIALPVILAALALAACGTAPRERIVTKTVRVPVSVPCVKDKPEPPTFAGDVVDLEGDIYVLSKALLVERQERRIYEGRLVAAMAGCEAQ